MVKYLELNILNNVLQNTQRVARKMSQWLGRLADLPDNTGSPPSTHTGKLTATWNSSSRGFQ